MLNENKLGEIRKYLTQEFKGYELADTYDFDRMAQTFRLVCGKVINLVTVSEEFIEDHSAKQISSILSSSNLSTYFQSKNVSRLIVTTSGLKTEPKR
jgi:hypothetical protein